MTSTDQRLLDNLITIEELSTRLGTPVATLRHWRAHGTGPRAFRLGRRLVYDEADVERYLRELKAASR